MCAALWHGLVQNHAFIDGNKRVGLRAADVFLALNGFDLTISAKEAVEWTLSIATGQLDRRELSQLVERRLRRL
jgi:death-on-curing protein